MRVTTTYTRLVRAVAVVATVLLAALSGSERLSALDDVYKLSQSTGTAYDMTGAIQLYGRSSLVASPLTNIGFTFRFDGRNYTTFSANTSGAMSLGSVTQRYYFPYYYPNFVSTGSVYNLGDKYPFLAVYWTYVGYPTTTGGLYYKVFGTAPNRVLVVEWRNVFTFGSSTSTSYSGGTFQARLYEGSNRLEYFYGQMTNGTASYPISIGLVSTATRYINVYGNNISQYYTYPSGGYYFYRYPTTYPMTSNRLFTFNPCEDTVMVAGNSAEGGTATMKQGDLLLEGKSVQRGSGATFYPFSLETLPNACDDLTYSATFSGAGAADYAVVPGSVRKGEKVSPAIRFTPQGVGLRSATMTLSLSNGRKYVYGLGAEGLTRIGWIGNSAEGGSAGLQSGDILLSTIDVDRGDSRDLRPFVVRNVNPDPTQGRASVSYTLDDPLDEYSLSVPGGSVTGSGTRQDGSVTIGANEANEPVITFAPHPGGTRYGTGVQEATLSVTADGETRTFLLHGFSVAPSLEMVLGGRDVITSDRNFYRNTVLCVGEEPNSLVFTMTNTNRADVVIDRLDIFEMDSRVQQGAPRYPQKIDPQGKLVPVSDYRLSRAPGVAPQRLNRQPDFPIVIPAGATETFHLTFVAQRPGKRYARAFLSTNAVNFFGEDLGFFTGSRQSGSYQEGLMTLDLFGQGLGSRLSSSASGATESPSLIFDPVKVGQSGEAETTVYNTGECDLRISVDQARLTSGDVEDFELLDVFGDATRVGQDYVIAPGGTATVKARFTPSRSGSRRATLMIATNDSTLGSDIMAAQGVHYMNFYGVGKAELRAYDLRLAPAVVDGPGSRGRVVLENTSSESIRLTGVELQGVNISEITQDPAGRWPSLPVQMQPGDVLEFGVALSPLPGSSPAAKNATVVFTYGSGDQVSARVSGLTGTRHLVATPASLFQGISIPIGSVIRRSAVVSNQGTFPVTIGDIRIEGTGGANYEVRSSGRRTIDAGGFEILEVVYAPRVAGSESATLVIDNNGTTGQLRVDLVGLVAGSSYRGGGDPSEISRGQAAEAGRVVGPSLSIGSDRDTPALVRQRMRLDYAVPGDGPVRLSLFDSRGSLVRELYQGYASGGTHEIEVDLRRLPSGLYLVRLVRGAEIVSCPIMVID